MATKTIEKAAPVPQRPWEGLKATLTVTSLEIDPEANDAEWEKIGQRLGQITTASQWWLGDWLINGYMQKRKRYKEAKEITGLDEQTLYNYQWVAQAIPPELRHPQLSWTHHLAVAREDFDTKQKKKYLDHAAAGRWSTRELKTEIRKDQGMKDLGTGEYAVCEYCGSKYRMTHDE